jgi:hypothetical protein
MPLIACYTSSKENGLINYCCWSTDSLPQSCHIASESLILPLSSLRKSFFIKGFYMHNHLLLLCYSTLISIQELNLALPPPPIGNTVKISCVSVPIYDPFDPPPLSLANTTPPIYTLGLTPPPTCISKPLLNVKLTLLSFFI